MAVTFWLLDQPAAGSGSALSGSLQLGGTAPAVATTGSGWKMGTTAANMASIFVYGGIQSAATFSSSNYPISGNGPDGLGDSWRTQNPVYGIVPSSSWLLSFSMIAVTHSVSGVYNIRTQLWMSPDPTGQTNLTSLSSGIVTVSGYSDLLTTAAQVINAGFTPGGGPVIINGQYIFIQCGCRITTASGNANAEAAFVQDPNNSFLQLPGLYMLDEDYGQGREHGFLVQVPDLLFQTPSAITDKDNYPPSLGIDDVHWWNPGSSSPLALNFIPPTFRDTDKPSPAFDYDPPVTLSQRLPQSNVEISLFDKSEWLPHPIIFVQSDDGCLPIFLKQQDARSVLHQWLLDSEYTPVFNPKVLRVTLGAESTYGISLSSQSKYQAFLASEPKYTITLFAFPADGGSMAIQGTREHLTAAFTDINGDLFTPTSVVMNVFQNNILIDTESYPAGNIVNDSTGEFHIDYLLPVSGSLLFQWVSTATGQEAKQTMTLSIDPL